jgi:hypothetical protein
MTKLSKKIRKSNKHLRNAIVLGNAFGHLEDLTEIFSTIFVFPPNDDFKKRNIIYVENIENLLVFPDIDVIFIDLDFTDSIIKLISVWRKDHSTFFIEGTESVGVDIKNALRTDRYVCKEVAKHHQVWSTEAFRPAK